MATKPLVHVIDDDEAMRDSLGFLLDTAGIASQAYESAVRFLETAAGGLAPGCVLTDVRMPEMSGLELIRRLKAMGVAHPVIVITGHGDLPLAVEAIRAGVVDFIEKPFDDETLLRAVRLAMASAAQSSEFSAEHRRFADTLATLSPRETDVLRGVLAGKANKIIAYDLGISPRTVEVYRANVMTKTGASGLSELVRMSLLAGF